MINAADTAMGRDLTSSFLDEISLSYSSHELGGCFLSGPLAYYTHRVGRGGVQAHIGIGYPRVCFGVMPVDEIGRSNDTDSSAGQQDLTSSQRAMLRQVVTALLKAAKDISFYPRNSPVIAQSLEHVISVLQKVVAMSDHVVFGVQQDQFLVILLVLELKNSSS